MTPALQSQLLNFLLAALSASASIGMRRDALLREARTNVSRSTTEPDLDTGLRDLADKGWVREYTPEIGEPRWRITDLGRDRAREEGLA